MAEIDDEPANDHGEGDEVQPIDGVVLWEASERGGIEGRQPITSGTSFPRRS